MRNRKLRLNLKLMKILINYFFRNPSLSLSKKPSSVKSVGKVLRGREGRKSFFGKTSIFIKLQ